MFKEFIYTVILAVGAIAVNIYWDDVQKLLDNKGEPVFVDSVFGRLKGQTGLTRGGRPIFKFTAIPYGKPPVQNLRFEPPIKYGAWKGILDATRKSPICTQIDTLWQKYDGQEDCLYLNVFSPRLKKTSNEKVELLPVMVFIHGGYFMYGSPELFGPDYLLDEDIVLVTINYRLNVLGFLNTADNTVKGNMGLKDQSMALKWVNEAIRDFGGDPNSVTLFGVSAGGASVSYHMISKMSEGLFHKSISQSGTSLCPWGFTQNPWEQATRFATLVGCPTKSSMELVKCLKKKPVEELVNIHHETMNIFHEIEAIFGPSIEYTDKNTDQAKVFLSESPTKLLEKGQFQKLPWINGVTKDEGCFRSALVVSDKKKLQEFNKDWTSIAPKTLLLYTDDPNISGKIKREYFPEIDTVSPKGRQIIEADLDNITNLYSDRYFLGCSKDATILHSRHAPVYLYYYTEKPDIGYGYILECSIGALPVRLSLITGYFKFLLYRYIFGLDIGNYGVCHTDELQQLFRLSPEFEISVNSEKFPFSNDLISLWVSFARDGQPHQFRGTDWIKVQKEDAPLRYLVIGKDVRMIDEPFTSRLKFWETLPLPKN